MKIKVCYYIPVEKEIEMTPIEYCYFHTNGTLNGKKIVPNGAIKEEIILDDEAQNELDNFFYNKQH